VGLEFALGHADIVGLSFLRSAEDLDAYLDGPRRGAATPRRRAQDRDAPGFEALPALCSARCGGIPSA
jgi:hypothetical protein